MNKNIAAALLAIILVIAALPLLFLPMESPAGLFSLLFSPGVNYSIDALSVYQSDTNYAGTGTAICTAINVTGATASCDTNLSRSASYRFELTISNSDSTHGFPTQLKFQDVYAASYALGSNASLGSCGCWDDDGNKAGTPSFSGNDVLCTLPTDNKCKIEKNDGSDLFYFVLTTGSDSATGSGTFFITEPGEDDDTSADTTFTYCQIFCDENADCDDSNSLTTDVCLNPGTCSADCNHAPCTVACNSDAGCDDSNSMTTDVCNNAGTCDASCSNTACTVSCNSNAGCDDSNSITTDICNNAGTCDANCSNLACTVSCDSNASCDDSNSMTVDVCLSPGTCSSSCSNALGSIACSVDANCDDSNVGTVDTCKNPGTYSSYCDYNSCTVACYADLGCDDGTETTSDYCFYAGQCNSYCANISCEVACIGDGDCGDGDPATVDKCEGAGTCDAYCTNTPCETACSADADCDDSDPVTADSCESPGTCQSSCLNVEQQQLTIEIASEINAARRGQVIDFNVLVKGLAGNAVENAELSLTDSAGNSIDLNSIGNGFYAGKYAVPADLPLGEQSFSFFAASAGMVGVQQLLLDVNTGIPRAVLIHPVELKAVPGQKVEFKFSLAYDSGEAVQEADVNASINGIPIPLQSDGNLWTGHYLFSEKDLPTAALAITALDSLGNGGTTTFAIEVEQPLSLALIALVVIALVVIFLVLYTLKRMHKLFFLEKKRSSLTISKKGKQLKRTAFKGRKAELDREIAQHDKEIGKAREEISLERKKQVLEWKRLPSESKYAAHKTAFSLSLLPGKLKRIFVKPEQMVKAMEAKKRIAQIEREIAELRERVQNLETEFCKHTIKEDYFRQKLFEYREQIHLLELEKKKLG